MSVWRPVDVRAFVRGIEEWWFDTTRGVQTAGNVRLPEASKVVGEIRDSMMYGPVRTVNGHRALADLPIKDFSEYTFIDVGSGKGRMLFVAAEYPFRRVIGVEFSHVLHEEAERNVQRYKFRKRRSGPIEPMLQDAATFEFPDGNLVLFLFNPFGPEVLGPMLANLQASLQESPRHALILLIWPVWGEFVASIPGMREIKKTRRHEIYELGPAQKPFA